MLKASLFVMAALSLLLAGCGGSSSSSETPVVTHQVVGTVALPAATDQVYTVYLDTDGDPTNGYVKIYQHFCDCGDFVEFFFDGIAPGSYYLYAVTTSEDGTQTFLGYYDSGSVITVAPADPNAAISSSVNQVFDFTLGVI